MYLRLLLLLFLQTSSRLLQRNECGFTYSKLWGKFLKNLEVKEDVAVAVENRLFGRGVKELNENLSKVK